MPPEHPEIDEKVRKRALRVLEIAERALPDWDLQLHFHGYVSNTDPESGIIAAANWNNPSICIDDLWVATSNIPERVCGLFEDMGIGIEWSDMIDTCVECHRVFETTPTYHGWSPSYIVYEDGDLVCEDCLDAEEYLESIEERVNLYCVTAIEPGEHGYVCVLEGLRSGYHQGQDDDPSVIARHLKENKLRRWLFWREGAGQYDVTFSLYIHPEGVIEDDDELVIQTGEAEMSGEDPAWVEDLRKLLKGNTKGRWPGEELRRDLEQMRKKL